MAELTPMYQKKKKYLYIYEDSLLVIDCLATKFHIYLRPLYEEIISIHTFCERNSESDSLSKQVLLKLKNQTQLYEINKDSIKKLDLGTLFFFFHILLHFLDQVRYIVKKYKHYYHPLKGSKLAYDLK